MSTDSLGDMVAPDTDGTPTFRWSDSRTRYGMVPEWVIVHPELGGTDVRLFALMALVADWHTRELKGKPLEELAERLGIHKTTIARAAAKLEAVGAVDVERRKADGFGYVTNRYVLAWDDPTDAKTPIASSAHATDSVASVQPPPLRERNTSTPKSDQTTTTTKEAADAKTHSQNRTVLDMARAALDEWAELTGAVNTRSYERNNIGYAREFVETLGRQPTADELRQMLDAGCKLPRGWPSFWSVVSGPKSAAPAPTELYNEAGDLVAVPGHGLESTRAEFARQTITRGWLRWIGDRWIPADEGDPGAHPFTMIEGGTDQ